MKKYNLTFWQRLGLPLLWIFWASSDSQTKKTWHEVKKGMEKHEHVFGPIYLHKGWKFRNCTHEGCNICTAMDDEGNWLDPL